MIRPTMEFEDEYELMAAEQAVALTRELKQRANATSDGRVLSVVELAALERGAVSSAIVSRTTQRPDNRPGEKRARGWCCPCSGHRRSHARPRGGSSPPWAT